MRANELTWAEISLIIPDELKGLIKLSWRFEKLKRDVYSEYANITEKEINMMIMIIHRVMAEYIKIIKMSGAFSESEVKDVKSDIHRSLSRFFDRDGRLIDLSREIIGAKNSGLIKEYSRTLIAPLMSFVEGRILDSVYEGVDSAKKELFRTFISSTVTKAGVMPGSFRAEDISLPSLKEGGGRGE